MAASTISRALTRRRRKSVASSANNIEALPVEGHERVLQRGADGRQAAHTDASEHQLAVAVLCPVAVETGQHGRTLDGEVDKAQALEDLGGACGVVGLDAQLGATRVLKLGDG